MKDITPYNIERFIELIGMAEKPVIVTHAKPDGDAVGSTSAMLHFLMKTCGKAEAKVVLNDDCPRYLTFIKDAIPAESLITRDGNIEKAKETIDSSDLIICLDFNAFHRADKLEKPLAESTAQKILIDHHLNPDRDSFDLCFSETAISSASELVYEVLMNTPVINKDARKLPAQAAVALMTGMTTDTNNFANSTYPSTLNMASDLLSAGVDRDRIINELYNKQRENRVRLMGHVLKDLLTITEDGVAYIVLDSDTQKKYDIREGETEGFVNIPLSISNVRMSFLLKEDGEKVRVSIRSRKGTSANRCARLYFNGGGHENAAGGRLFMPKDINDISEAGDYIARHTHTFLTEQ